ncbi:SH3 domain-containing protein [Pontibacter sp. G13]|uniref:SH3 domain-containing protein n=1 Tax=Pontibacter sp. G13 TaxID=3074898 RepID=UPI00288BACDB|nr:SH3 domain-containing protein [Pontibacter sp. G13]WNJ17623.1 SH3 domain-containing protein [Pontibacter sp. G13]
MNRLFFLLLAWLGSAPLFAQVPADQTYLDPSFGAFRHQLMNCVLNQDTSCLKELLADTVMESKDGCDYPGCPKDKFIQYLFGDPQYAQTQWDLLKVYLRFGFISVSTQAEKEKSAFAFPRGQKVEGRIFQAPIYLNAVDRQIQMLILGENVNIRKSPSTSAPVVKRVSFEVVNCDCGIEHVTEETFVHTEGRDWIQVLNADREVIGYVAQSLTSFQYSRILTIAKVDGDWKIISFFQLPGC